MKTRILFIVITAIACSTLFAEIPTAVLSQLREDLKGAMMASGAMPTDDQVAQALDSFEKELPESKLFEFTPAELEAFQTGTSAPRDTDIAKAIAEIKKLVGGRPLPHLLSFYDAQQAGGKLGPKQKILCQRLSTVILARLREKIPDKK